MNVVVAGRVSIGDGLDVLDGWLADDVDVVDCAAALDATARVNAAAIIPRFNIRTSASKADTRRIAPIRRSSLLAGRFSGQRRRDLGRFHQPAAATAADLAALAPGVAGFVGRPFVCSPLLVCGAPALAGDLALFLRGHRSEPAAFLALSVVHRTIL
jgi:hypothetical protein